MFRKNIKPVVLAGALALATAVSPVFAEDKVPNVMGDGNTVEITKDVQFAYGATFDGKEVSFVISPVTEDAPQASISNGGKLTFGSADNTETPSGTVHVSKTLTLSFGTFPHAGEYVYTLTETADPDLHTVTGTTTSYKIRVYVVNSENGLVIKQITADKGENDKVGQVKFENKYYEVVDPGFTVTKKIEGNYANKKKKFDFTVVLTKPDVTNNDSDTYTYTINGTEATGTYGAPLKIQLSDGDKFQVGNLPAGTTYTVTEAGVTDTYVPSAVKNDGEITYNDKGDADELAVSGVVTDAKSNKVEFTNTCTNTDNIITGIITNNAPYIVLLGASGAGLAALAGSKKRSKK